MTLEAEFRVQCPGHGIQEFRFHGGFLAECVPKASGVETLKQLLPLILATPTRNPKS